MDKVKLLFRATKEKKTHLRDSLWLKDGNTAVVPWQNAKKLIEHWPENFFQIEVLKDWKEELKYIVELFNSPAHTYKITEMRVVPHEHGDRLLVRYNKKL